MRLPLRHSGLQNAIAAAVMLMVVPAPAAGLDLSVYRWEQRLLMVFAPERTDPDFQAFDRRLSEARDEVTDRDLVVFRVFETGRSSVNGRLLPLDDAEALRHRFDAPSGRLTVVLIGKDGGVKLVRQDRADLQEIFDRIDAMPMRRQEMRDRERQ